MEFSNDLQLALYKSYGLLRQLIQKFQCVYWTGFVIRITNCNLTRLQWGIYLFTIDQLTCPYTCIQLLSVPGSRRIGTGWLTLNTNLIQSLIIQFNLLLVLSRWSKRLASIQQHLIYESLIIHHQQNVLLIHRIRHLTSIHYCSRFHNRQIQLYLYMNVLAYSSDNIRSTQQNNLNNLVACQSIFNDG